MTESVMKVRSKPLVQQASFVIVRDAEPTKELVLQRLGREVHHQFSAAHNQLRVLINAPLRHATGVVLGPQDFAADMKIAGSKQLESRLLVFGAREWPTVL